MPGVKKLTIASIVFVLLVAIGGGIYLYTHRSSGYGGTEPQRAVLFSRPIVPGPLQKAYQAKTDAALASDQPVVLLEGLDGDKAAAQAVAIALPEMREAARDPASGEALRSQVFQVYPLPGSQATGDAVRCAQGLRCYVVEVYFFADNATGKAVIGLGDASGAPITVRSNITGHSQPELPADLTEITKEMIRGSQELKETVGGSVNIDKLTMVNGKTALAGTRCDRSEHLCVAPTLAMEEDAVWIIVDLTDFRIAGVTWTKWKDAVPDVPPSEQVVIDNAIMRMYCGVDTQYDKAGWKFSYSLTGSDGIEVKDVSYKGTAIIASAKNTDWHVSYSQREGFGYSDAVGCPVFSAAAVVPAVEPYFSDIKDAQGNKVGYELVQEFKSKLWPQPCNYYYQQRFQFFDDGSFRPAVVNLGRGCGDDATYRPVTRVQPAVQYTRIEAFEAGKWQAVGKETWQKDSGDAPLETAGGAVRYRLSPTAGGRQLTMELGRGQFGDGGRGDQAWTFVNRFHADRDEGASDQATLGACCNTDYRQGPEEYTNDEDLAGAPLLLWYVAEQKNSGTAGAQYCWADAKVARGTYKMTTYPCVSGPRFTLSGGG